MAGKPVEKYLALNSKDAMYQGAKNYLTQFALVTLSVLFGVLKTKPPCSGDDCRRYSPNAIEYLEDAEKEYGRWKNDPPSGSGLAVVQGGKAISYDGKEYFYEDALITKLLKKVRFSK